MQTYILKLLLVLPWKSIVDFLLNLAQKKLDQGDAEAALKQAKLAQVVRENAQLKIDKKSDDLRIAVTRNDSLLESIDAIRGSESKQESSDKSGN